LNADMSASRHATRLDPRAPLVLDTRELGRRAGSMRRVQRTAPAPTGWELGLVGVPAGSDVRLELRLEAVMDGVLVSGTIVAPIRAECGRCLEPVEDDVEVEVQELFAYEPDPEDEAAVLVEGELIDLEPVTRDAVLLGLPLNPVCREDCAGLCAGCGEPLAGLAAGHTHDEIDPRWAALAAVDTEPEMGS
jgi:uncharacterized protein